MVEVQLLIPLADNGGVEFEGDHIAAFEQNMRDVFGNISVMPGTGHGSWKMSDGSVVIEPWRIYLVAVDSLLASGNAIHSMAQFAAAHFRQEGIYVRYLGIAEVVLNPHQ